MSWLDVPTKIVRDPGSPGTYEPVDPDKPEGEKQLVMVWRGTPPQYVPKDPPRNAWPAGVGVKIKATFGTEDFALIERLKLKSNIAMRRMNESYAQRPSSNSTQSKSNIAAQDFNEDDILQESQIYFAVMVEGFEGLEAFEDPRTRVNGEPGTGKVLEMPPISDLQGRLDIATGAVVHIPFQVVSFVMEEIGKVVNDPLEGTVAVNGSKSGSELVSIRSSNLKQTSGRKTGGKTEKTPTSP